MILIQSFPATRLTLGILRLQTRCRSSRRFGTLFQQSVREQPFVPVRTRSIPRTIQEVARDWETDEFGVWRWTFTAIVWWVLSSLVYSVLLELELSMRGFFGYTVNLPELLAATSLDPESMGVLKENMVQFLAWVLSFVLQLVCLSWASGRFHRWMDLNRRVLFVKEYIGTSSGYQNNNRGWTMISAVSRLCLSFVPLWL